MTDRVLIAAELRDLLEPDPTVGLDVVWLGAQEATPHGDYVGVVPLLSRAMGAPQFDGLPRLKVVANCAVGYDNVDLEAAARRRIVVTNTPDVLTDATADLTWALLLAVARRLKEGQALISAARWTGWHPTQLLGMELRGSTLGIVGAGRIGRAVGLRAPGFGMRVVYASLEPAPDLEAQTGARRVELEELLASSDVVTVHVPSTSATRGLFGARAFARMKPGALFVNTSRGDVVDESALLEAVDAGRLAGAGLDVFAQEPSVPAALAEHPRVVTLPHLGSATTDTRRAMARLAVENLTAVLRGDRPLTPVEWKAESPSAR